MTHRWVDPGLQKIETTNKMISLYIYVYMYWNYYNIHFSLSKQNITKNRISYNRSHEPQTPLLAIQNYMATHKTT
jgi:hypothetical protein